MVKKILIIDDDPMLLKSVKVVLEKTEYQVTTAEDGVEGCALFDKGGFDMVITDILMPNKDGIKTISYIRKVNKEIPILAISGAGMAGAINNLSAAMLMGATETLAKPFKKEALLGAVKACLKVHIQV